MCIYVYIHTHTYTAKDMDKYAWINMHTSVYHITHRQGKGVRAGDLLVPRHQFWKVIAAVHLLFSSHYRVLLTIQDLLVHYSFPAIVLPGFVFSLGVRV